MPDEITKKVKGGLPETERGWIMWSDDLREITPDGKVVWEWIGYEHMDPEIGYFMSSVHSTKMG